MTKVSKTIKCAVDSNGFVPEKAYEKDAGFYIRTPIDFWIFPWGHKKIDTGVHVAIPEGYEGKLESKSGLNVNHNIWSTGVIDCGYTGSIVVKLYMLGFKFKHFKRGDKISQLVINGIHPASDVELVDSVGGDFGRGNNGFGSTGR